MNLSLIVLSLKIPAKNKRLLTNRNLIMKEKFCCKKWTEILICYSFYYALNQLHNNAIIKILKNQIKDKKFYVQKWRN